ncbi:Fic family protein [Runella defluvii]|uniref:Fic family protein n=1 Tax=Runella defluvii TaxID=370973 RepID=A0A7W5ZRH2_9BACT|nr:Fic/DOC family N-terminal domain-containing protein [Runella defluvii]MBB3842330.1 Fic family protein [Runella defluvii]
MSYRIKELPNIGEIETKKVLKKSLQANKALAELKGILATIPDQNILINTLSLQEAKDSSAIENVITTHDELFKASLNLQVSAAAKEVQSYASALKRGHDLVRQYGFLSTKHLLHILDILEPNNGAIRRLPGTVLKNQQTGEVVYMPPQDYEEIIRLMSNLEQFINNDELADWDSLVKMAIIHFQFESIHPFYDGNGRTGRIINLLYLVLKDLLDVPVLYLSRYIVRYKGQYYQKLQAVRDDDDWESWICFMLEAVENTALYTIDLIKAIRVLLEETKVWCQESHPKIYSRELLDNLFKHPYTKIEFVMQDCQVC